MKENERKVYETPQMEVIEVDLEMVVATSSAPDEQEGIDDMPYYQEAW